MKHPAPVGAIPEHAHTAVVDDIHRALTAGTDLGEAYVVNPI